MTRELYLTEAAYSIAVVKEAFINPCEGIVVPDSPITEEAITAFQIASSHDLRKRIPIYLQGIYDYQKLLKQGEGVPDDFKDFFEDSTNLPPTYIGTAALMIGAALFLGGRLTPANYQDRVDSWNTVKGKKAIQELTTDYIDIGSMQTERRTATFGCHSEYADPRLFAACTFITANTLCLYGDLEMGVLTQVG